MTPLEIKQVQFNAAMDLYENTRTYKRIDMSVAIVSVSLQIFLLWRILPLPVSPWHQLAAFVFACLLTDFVNGLIHLYMDVNDNYDSFAGPLIAKFHLHHRTPRYKDRNILAVYLNETGSKVWMPFYLTIVALLSSLHGLNPVVLHVLLYFGILSSVGEVSHYLCHNSNSPIAIFLGRSGLLLPKRVHARHHLEDNVNYSFLNGLTNPLVNCIARRWASGYKQGTDLHFATYVVPDKPKT